jgi:hypothetical protein
MQEPKSLTAVIKCLQQFYGRPKPPKIKDALELMLWENVAYLVDDEKRATAFALLKKRVGTKVAQILKATDAQLEEATRLGGMLLEMRALRLLHNSFPCWRRSWSAAMSVLTTAVSALSAATALRLFSNYLRRRVNCHCRLLSVYQHHKTVRQNGASGMRIVRRGCGRRPEFRGHQVHVVGFLVERHGSGAWLRGHIVHHAELRG